MFIILHSLLTSSSPRADSMPSTTSWHYEARASKAVSLLKTDATVGLGNAQVQSGLRQKRKH